MTSWSWCRAASESSKTCQDASETSLTSRLCEFTHADIRLLPPDMHTGMKMCTSALLLLFYLLDWTDTVSINKVQSTSATTVDFAVKTKRAKILQRSLK